MTETLEPMSAQIDQQQLARQLVEQARAEGRDGLEKHVREASVRGSDKAISRRC